MQNSLISSIVDDVFRFSDKKVIANFSDANRESHIDIISAANCPQNGVTSYSTIGLSRHPLIKGGEKIDVGIEICGACSNKFVNFDVAISTAAFCVINSKWFCAPGIIFPEIISAHNLSSTLHDMYFMPPFFWSDPLFPKNVDDVDENKKLTWVQAIPISRAESQYARENGPLALEDLLEDKEVDVLDLQRASVI